MVNGERVEPLQGDKAFDATCSCGWTTQGQATGVRSYVRDKIDGPPRRSMESCKVWRKKLLNDKTAKSASMTVMADAGRPVPLTRGPGRKRLPQCSAPSMGQSRSSASSSLYSSMDPSDKLIAIGAVGGAISAMVSMGFGEFECAVGTIKARVGAAVAMAAATLAGCLIPIWGFFVLPRTAALCVAGGGALAIAGMIGQAKHKGVQGHVEAFATLLVAIALSFGVIALLPSAG